MRVTMINGSPHRAQGSTGRLAGALLSGMADAGAKVEVFYAYDLTVSGCRGCFTCWTKTPGCCVIRDDMDAVLAGVRDSEMLIVATPVYCDGMTGPTKTVLDRMIPLVHGSVEFQNGHMRHPQRKDTQIRKMALVSTCGFVERDNFDPLIAHIKAMATNLGCGFGGALTVTGGVRPDRIDQIAAAAREAGGELVRTGAIPEHLQVAMLGHSVAAGHAAAGMSRYFDAPPSDDWSGGESDDSRDALKP